MDLGVLHTPYRPRSTLSVEGSLGREVEKDVCVILGQFSVL